MDSYSCVSFESRVDYRYVIDGFQICHKRVFFLSQMDHGLVKGWVTDVSYHRFITDGFHMGHS